MEAPRQEGRQAESKDLHSEYFQLAEKATKDMEELFGVQEGMTDEEEKAMEEAFAKDPLIAKMMSGENPSERLKAAQDVKIPLLGILGKAAKVRNFMLTSPEFKRMAEISEQWTQEEEARKIKQQIENSAG